MLKNLAIGAGLAVTAMGGAAAHDTFDLGELTWQEIVPGMVEFAAVGAPWDQGPHVKYVRFPPGAVVPMHKHSGDYHAVLISGELTNMFDSEDNATTLAPGGYWFVAGDRPHGHVCQSSEPCIAYTHSDSAWDVATAE